MERLQQGSSLIEILVTALIVSVGLLGLAVLQANSLRFNHDAYLRSIATLQAESMADRIRANPAGVQAGAYNNVTGVGADPGCNPCDATQQAQADIFQWNSRNANALPNGQGTVTVAGNIYTITVRWDARRTGATGLNCSGDPDQDLTCLSLSIGL